MPFRAPLHPRLALAPLCAGLLLLAARGDAAAQTTAATPPTDSFDVQLFQAAIGSRPFLTIDSAHTLAHKQFGLSLVTNYQRNPFTLYTVSGTDSLRRSVDVVRDQAVSDLSVVMGLGGSFQLGLSVPLTLHLNGEQFTPTGEAAGTSLSGGGLGDLRVEGKARVASFGADDQFLFSVAPGVTVPTGDSAKYLGDESLTGRLRAITELRVDDFRAAAMLGVLLRKPSTSFKAKVGQQLLYGVAAEYMVRRDFGLLGELFGRSGLEDFGKRYVDANPVELDLGMRVRLPQMFTITAGGGLGLVKGIGSPAFRGFLGLAWVPDFRDRDSDGVYDADDRCADEAEDSDGFKDSDGCPEVDNDGDGLLDAQDRCATEAEDLDQFQDDDGCPDLDNDGDGTPDLNDPCPNAAEDARGKRPQDGCPSSAEDSDGDAVPDALDKCGDDPEDRDQFQDDDGCPDPDNDEDTIPDNFDLCPNQGEDADGFNDADGCPDPDNDKDGVSDAQDRCPAEAETLNGSKDDDGCPDPGAEIVRFQGGKIELRERVAFAPGNRPALSAGGEAVVKLCAMLLRGHAEITKVTVAVTGGSKDLAQARADAVVASLVAQGVDAGRLRSSGAAGAGAPKVELVVDAVEEPKSAAGQ